MIDLNELRDRAATFGSDYLTDEEWVEVIDRLEAAEKERDWNAERLEDAIEELTALRAKVEAMEKQEPAAVVESWTSGSYSRNYKLLWLRVVN